MENPQFKIIYQDPYIIVMNKLSPFPVQSDKKKSSNGLDMVIDKFHLDKKQVDLIHRIDQPATGLLVVGTNKEYNSDLFKQFREQAVKKMYPENGLFRK